MLARMSAEAERRLTTWESLKAAAGSWRLGAVALLSFSSGLPLGLVWLAIPAWMTQIGVDIKVVGLFTLVQAPWTFKVLWAPVVDRYPLPLLGRKRGWILLSQAVLLGLGLWLSAVSSPPEPVGLIGVICLATAVASATQDIAYDAYTVEVLRKEEQSFVVAARFAAYRVAMWISGRLSITLAAVFSWAAVNLWLALVYLPAMLVTWRAPEPEALPPAPRTLRQALWEPFVGLLARHRALEILAFVVLYKLSDNLTQALTGPFLIQTGYSAWDVGVGAGTVSLFAMIAGTFLGGLLIQVRGLGPGLWISGFLQIFSNLGYAVVAMVGVNRPAMYGAQAFEYVATGMGSAAFGVLLLRLTEKRFSATQFALLSSLFGIPRVLAGPPAGLLADAIGWRDFFVLTIPFGVPGMMMLQRFAPWGVRDPAFPVAALARRRPLSRWAVAGWGILTALATWAGGVLTLAALAATRSHRSGQGFDLALQVLHLLAPRSPGDWVSLIGTGVLAAATALLTAAALVARRGIRRAGAG